MRFLVIFALCDSDTLQAVPLGYIGNTYTLESLMYKKLIKMDSYHFIKANFMKNIHPSFSQTDRPMILKMGVM